MERLSLANCLANAQRARLQASNSHDARQRAEYTEIAEMWEHMA